MISRIEDAWARFAAGKITVRDAVSRAYSALTDEKACRRALAAPAEFLGITHEQALLEATSPKSNFYREWDSAAKSLRLDDVGQAELYKRFTYYVAALPYRHRHKSFWFLSKRLPRGGSMLEYGCGTAIPTSWLLHRRPDVAFTVADIPSRTLEFVRWKFKDRVQYAVIPPGGVPQLSVKYDVIVCLDVLEHVPNPDDVVQLFVRQLNTGGRLFIDFLGFDQLKPGSPCNLYSSQMKRREAIDILNQQLTPIHAINPSDPLACWGVYTTPVPTSKARY